MACCEIFKNRYYPVFSPKVIDYNFDWFIRREIFHPATVSLETASRKSHFIMPYTLATTLLKIESVTAASNKDLKKSASFKIKLNDGS